MVRLSKPLIYCTLCRIYKRLLLFFVIIKSMKKFITAVVMVGVIVPAYVFADTASTSQLQALYQSTLKQVIALLIQEVAGLEAQLAALTNVSKNSSSSEPVFCMQEAKECPDGSYVGRSGPTCAFAACPNASSSATSTVLITAPSSTSSVATTTSGISAASISQAGKMPFQEIGMLTIAASNSGPIELGSLKLTFSGNGYTAGSSTFLNTVALKDPNSVDVASSFGATVVRDAGAGTISWTFPTSVASPAVVASDAHLTLQLWGTTNIIPGTAGTSESLSAIVQNPGDLTFYDGADSTAIAAGSIPLSITAVPITVASLSWGVGM